MKVKNTETMLHLLSAIGLKQSEVRFINNGTEIELLLNPQQLMYYINSQLDLIKKSYDGTNEWNELKSFFNGIYQ